MQAFDRMLGRRTLLLALVVTCLALVVVVLTDEPGSTAGMRAARLAALGPAFAALSGWVVMSQVRLRGELRALEAIGASPRRAMLGVAMAGWLIGTVCVAVLCMPSTDVHSLFPVLPEDHAWRLDGGSFLEPIGGVRVTPAGSLESARPTWPSATRVVDPGPMEALMLVGPLAVVLPAWLTSPASALSRLTACSVTAALAIVLLHLVATGSTPAATLTAASAPIVLHLLVGHATNTPPRA